MGKYVKHEHANVLLGDRVFHGTLCEAGQEWMLVTTRDIARTPVYDFAERIHLRMFDAQVEGPSLIAEKINCGAYSEEGWTFAEAQMQEG